jgi:hypothetical protein
MQRRAFFVSLAIALLFTGSIFAQTLGAVLTGSQEVPPTTTPGFGNATVTFDSARQNITVTITVANLGSPISAAHIHKKDAGSQTGNVFIGFTASMFANGKLTQTVPVTADQANQILQNPSNFYVNVHTSQFPGGAIRGDLAIVSGTVQSFVADLRGANEVPPNGSTAFGTALLTFDTVNNTIAFEANTTGITSPSAAHIHPGVAGAMGGVLIGFATSPSAFTGGRIKGMLTGVDATQMSNIIANPAGFYFNVHSSSFPGGEIRGQLAAAQEVDIPVAGHVTNAMGQTFISDVRIFNPSFDTATSALVEFFQASTTANTNATNSLVVNLPARGTAVLNDVAGTSGLNITGIGAIRVSSVANIVATSRIFVNTANGSFGQFVAGLNRSSALRRGVIPQVSNTTGFRANAGFFNPNISAVTVRLEARDPFGTLLGSNALTLQALSQQQNSLASFFPGTDLSNAANLTVSFDASAGIFAYVSEVDNTSGDSILIPGQPDSGVAASQ